jgi:nucleoside-diphosphate-sugar epimerase
MTDEIVIFGYGPTGEAIARQLLATGRQVKIVQRRRPELLPEGAGFEACDVLDGAAVSRVAAGASAIICAIGMPYLAKVWEEQWPIAMANLLTASALAGARFLFIDNVYMYGPQTDALEENMPLTDFGRKPKLRAALTRQWQAAAKAGRVKVAALRAPDFYGPGVALSILGDASIGAMAKGKAATLISAADVPHAVAFVPDIARAAILLLDAPDDAWGQAWHLPCAPARSLREILGMAANTLGLRARIRALPAWLISVMGLFQPFLKEWSEMGFQQQRPLFVDGSKFTKRFGFRPTSLEEGIRETALAFRRV